MSIIFFLCLADGIMARKKRIRRAQAKQTKKSGVGEAWFIGTAALLGATAYFLKDALGIQYRWIGVYIWLAAFLFGFIFYLFYLLQFILPLDWLESWFEGLRLSIPYNFPLVGAVARALLGRRRMPAASQAAGARLSSGFVEHRAGIVNSNLVLDLTKGPEYARAIGPGYVRLEDAEMVTQVIDLRRHYRLIPVQALTRDGIPIEGTISILFQVKQDQAFADSTLPYPYDPGAIFWVDYLDNFRSDDGLLPWYDHIAPLAANELITELSRYSLDELFTLRTERSLIDDIRHEISDQLVEEYDRFGVTILRVSLGQLRVADEVAKRRLQSWQEEWEGRVSNKPENVDDFSFERRKLAAAKAQIQLVRRAVESIETMHRSSNAELTDVVLSRLLEAVSSAMENEAVQELLPDDVRAGTTALGIYRGQR